MFQGNSLSLASVLLQDPSEMSAECSNGVLTSLTTQSISWQCKDRILYTSHTQHRQGNVETFPVWQSRRRQELSDRYRAHKKFETILMWKFWNDGFLRVAIGLYGHRMLWNDCWLLHQQTQFDTKQLELVDMFDKLENQSKWGSHPFQKWK
jgi:hypothetical protein